ISGQSGGGAMDNRRIRLDHNYFNSLATTVMFQISTAYGIADHNKVVGVTGSILFKMFNPVDYAWANSRWSESLASPPYSPAGWGTDQFFFLEDNYLNGGVFTDGYGGSRLVGRFNTTIGGYFWEVHGTDTSTRVRGSRAWEIYGNSQDAMS